MLGWGTVCHARDPRCKAKQQEVDRCRGTAEEERNSIYAKRRILTNLGALLLSQPHLAVLHVYVAGVDSDIINMDRLKQVALWPYAIHMNHRTLQLQSAPGSILN